MSKLSILDTTSFCCHLMCHRSHKESLRKESELQFGDSSATKTINRTNIFPLWHWAVLTLMFIIPNRSDVGCACAQEGVTLCWQVRENLPVKASPVFPLWMTGIALAPKHVTMDCYFLGGEEMEKIFLRILFLLLKEWLLLKSLLLISLDLLCLFFFSFFPKQEAESCASHCCSDLNIIHLASLQFLWAHAVWKHRCQPLRWVSRRHSSAGGIPLPACSAQCKATACKAAFSAGWREERVVQQVLLQHCRHKSYRLQWLQSHFSV